MMTDELNAEQNQADPAEIMKGFRTSVLAGATFGLVAGIIIMLTGFRDYPAVLFVPGMAVALGIVAGLAGLIGGFFDLFLSQRGIKESSQRSTLSFVLVAVIVIGLFVIGSLLLGDGYILAEMQRFALPGAVLGLIFGGTVNYLNHRFEKDKQQMLTLEMENRYLSELAEKNQLLEEAGRNLAVTEEQNRMARELHDSISQGIHGIVFSLHSLRRLIGDEGHEAEIVNHLEETTQATMKELRRLIMELTPSPLEEQGLVEAVELHTDLFARRQQMTAEVTMEYNGGLTPEQEVSIYRILQEALANVQKHANAKKIIVSLLQRGDTVILRVQDNGNGFVEETTNKGQGIKNMSTRALHGGGQLHLASHPGQGTAVEVTFPMEANR